MTQPTEEFPISGLLPKKETGVVSFLTKYPTYDGRGTIIAIFDSGVDPRAPGLQVTSDGKPKVIGIYNCSGSGDVDTSTVVKAVNNEIKGLSGRVLKIPAGWKNPSGEYRIGMKSKYVLGHKTVKDRLQEEYKEKSWDPKHKIAVNNVNKRLNDFMKKTEEQTVLTPEQKLEKEELESTLETLNTVDKKFTSVGSIFDIVLFDDGEQWRIVVDTSECGDLASCELLYEFSKNPKSFSQFSKNDQITYSFNVFNDGNTVEIATCATTHGTHVASIAAANYPNEPEKNGVAPGAQIVSFAISDTRLGGNMETGVGLMRAMTHVMKYCGNDKQIHVINMSYGEHAHFSSTGRIGEFMKQVIDKYGVVWVASASNSGPALFTIGSPPDIDTDSVIGVGAYVSPEMMAAEYSLRGKAPGMAYTWSSRDPTLDGRRAVSICAPGGAITSVPLFTLRRNQLMNGTSMSAPHVTGAVAVIISGLLQKGIKYTPYSVKRALENTAIFQTSTDVFAQGRGLLQVEKAFDHLSAYYGDVDVDVRFKIHTSNGDKGIIVRRNEIEEFMLNVEPIFFNSKNIDPNVKLNFEMLLCLTCDASYVQIPKFFQVANYSRQISIKVDPTALKTGVYNTSVNAFDSNNPEKGPVFDINITVMKYEEVKPTNGRLQLTYDNVHFDTGAIKRHFIMVPHYATTAVVTVSSDDVKTPGRFILHSVQIRPQQTYKTLEYHKLFAVKDKYDQNIVFKVEGGLILEVAMAKFWSNMNDKSISYTIQFIGCRPNQSSYTMHHAEGLFRMEVYSNGQSEELSPSVQLKNNTTILKPVDSNVTAVMDERDEAPEGNLIYQLILTYNFHLQKNTEVFLHNPYLSDYLYESEFESQLWLLYDCNKRYISAGDAYPYPDVYNVKLDKGDYVVKHQIRHDKKELLEKLLDSPMTLSWKLPNAITMDIYYSQGEAFINGKKCNTFVMPPADHILPIFVSPLTSDKLLKPTTIGQYLSGTVSFVKQENAAKVDQYPFKYILLDVGKKKSTENKDKDKETKDEEYEESKRDFMSTWISKLEPGSDLAFKLYKEIRESYGDYTPVYAAILQNLDTESNRWSLDLQTNVPTKERLERIITIANEALENISLTEILSYVGTKQESKPEAKLKTILEQKKTTLMEVMGKKGSAICQLYLLEKRDENSVSTPTITMKEIDTLWWDMMKLAEPLETKATTSFSLWHALVHEHFGKLSKILLKLLEEKPTLDTEKNLLWVFSQLKWNHCSELFEGRIIMNYPKDYQLF